MRHACMNRGICTKSVYGNNKANCGHSNSNGQLSDEILLWSVTETKTFS
jgi:hypothetical protein